MSPLRATTVLALAILLWTPLAGAESAAAPAEPPVWLDARTPVVHETLVAAHDSFLLRPAFESPPELELLLAFSQPVVRGQDDLISVVWVRPLAGTWSGAWMADSSAGVTSPRKVTIGAEGLFLLVDGGSLANGDRVTVTYTFVSETASAWTFSAPPAPILDGVRQKTVAFAGASASVHGHDDIPEGLLLTVWNLLQRDARMGFTVLDAEGAPIFDAIVGDCLTGEGNTTQAGCRATYLLERAGHTIISWHAKADGTRVVHETHLIADIADAPVVFGAKKLDRAPPMPFLEARVGTTA